MPLRTMLFAPGNHARRVEKAFEVGADAVILDLEDAVAVSEKSATRALVVEALGRPRRCAGYVRVNAMDTPFCFGDLAAVVRPGVDGIMLPKIESARHLFAADWIIAQLERERGLPEGGFDLLPIVETAKGFANLADIVSAGTRVRRFAFGAGDFALDTNMNWTAGERELTQARASLVTTCRAADLEPPIDSVWVRLDDADGLKHSAEFVAGTGFQGKMCIHPAQIPVVNAVFTPGDAEIAMAERIVAAFAQAEARGEAAFQLDGKFVDYPIVFRARRVLATIQAIRDREQAA
ncbi:HpcH/HpaI aldolase/citrate lyase family protein [Roseixanthobacter glucoisosaccharinicivorans]|uniref:HpcH/HpaI aldolase/citrate lyase family protein n=1 Tax=Roseixanthobacter glucoisosaccharinicivorans TaxID=3119923 RepID=UPI00372A2136